LDVEAMLMLISNPPRQLWVVGNVLILFFFVLEKLRGLQVGVWFVRAAV
jgi:hypothetical protein